MANESQSGSDSQSPPPAAKRSFLRRPAGWFTLLFVALVAFLIALPTIASGFAPEWIEQQFSKRFAGRLEVGELQLGWRGRQSVESARLFDPEDQEVASFDVRLPSLAELIMGRGRELGLIEVELAGDLIAKDGESNLQRALEPRPGKGVAAEESSEPGQKESEPLPEAEVRINVTRLSWSDERTRAIGNPFVLEDTRLHANTRPGAPLALTVMGRVRSEEASELRLEAEVFDLDAGGTRPVRAELSAQVDSIPSALVDALANQGGRVTELLGPTAALRASGSGSLESGHANLELQSERATAKLAVALQDGILSIAEDAPAQVSLELSPALVRELTAEALPEDVALNALATRAPLRVNLTELAFPLDAYLAAEDDNARTDILDTARAQLILQISDLKITKSGQSFELEDMGLDLNLTPDSPLRVAFNAGLSNPSVDSSPGQLALQATVQDPLTFIEDASAPSPTIEIQVSARSIPSAPIDSLAKQDGLLTDALGETLDLEFKAAWPADETQPVEARLTSSRAALEFRGRFSDGALFAAEEDGLRAQLPLTPLVSERLLGNLVPVLLNVRKPESAAPVELVVSDFRLPLDGDLSKLSASVNLALGQIGYELLPKMRDYWASYQRSQAVRTTTFDPFDIRVTDGTLHYEALPLRIDGRNFPLTGSFRLADKSLDFDTNIPLKDFGGEIEKALDKARRYLDPDIQVPIEIGGTLLQPRVRVSSGFMQTVVEEAAQGALQRGLGDFLRKQLGDD